MKIREVKESDLSELAKLAQKVWAETFGHGLSEQELKQELSENRSVSYFKQAMKKDTILVAEEDQKLLGYVQFGNINMPEINAKKDDQEFHRLYVDTEHQSKGIGRKLTDKALAHPRLAQAKNIYLQVWEENKKAVNLYKSYGFAEKGKTNVYAGDRVIGQDLIMVLKK